MVSVFRTICLSLALTLAAVASVCPALAEECDLEGVSWFLRLQNANDLYDTAKRLRAGGVRFKLRTAALMHGLRIEPGDESELNRYAKRVKAESGASVWYA